MMPKALTLALCVLATAMTIAEAAPVGDHYLCYTARVARGRDLPVFASRRGEVVRDAFSSTDPLDQHRLDVRRPVGLCAPADKNGEGVLDDVTHLEAYGTRQTRTRPRQPRFAPRRVEIENQLGRLVLDVRAVDRLLMPSAKALGEGGAPPLGASTVPHFNCYTVRVARARRGTPPLPRFNPARVTTLDQFGLRVLDLTKPTRLCVPADLNDLEPAAPSRPEQLVCYQARLARTEPRQARLARTRVSTTNGFGAEVLGLRRLDELCIPSLRDAAMPTATPTGPTPSAPGSTPSATGPTPSATGPTPSPSATPSGSATPGEVLAVVVSPETRAIDPGEKTDFVAMLARSDGGSDEVTDRVVWTSSDESVATISNAPADRGRATGVLPGVVTIAAADPVSGLDSTTTDTSAALSVLGQLERIALAPTVATHAVGEVRNYVATGHYVGGGTQNVTQLVVYGSSDPAVAAATNQEGSRSRVEMVGPGTAMISATDPVTGVTSTTSGDDATITVVGALERIVLTPTAVTHGVDEVRHFTATGHFEGGTTRNITQDVVYASSDPAVAAATNQEGSRSRVEMVGPGTAMISATDPVTGVTSTASGDDATITVVGALERIVLTPTAVTHGVDEVRHFTATGHFEGGTTRNVTQDVVYASSDPAVAAATNQEGSRSRVEMVGPGTAMISATDPVTGVTSTASGDDATITVVGPLERITLTPTSSTRPVGGEQNYTATGHFAGGVTRSLTQDLIYASSDIGIALPTNQDGNRSRVLAVGEGTAEISATDPATGVSTSDTGDNATLIVTP